VPVNTPDEANNAASIFSALSTAVKPFSSIAGAAAVLIANGTGVIKIKGDTADSASAETPTLTTPMTLQAINGSVSIGAP
jgi:negative regulator of sigma E activity